MSNNRKVFLISLVVLMVGCGKNTRPPDGITSGYGRKSGAEFVNSLNGTAVFAEMVRASGDTTGRSDSITPRIKKYDQIIWFRDRYESPSQEAIDALVDWLSTGNQCQLIVVGRDSDSAIDYWSKVVATAKGQDLLEARRRLAKIKSRFQRRRTERNTEEDSCAWFSFVENDYQPATRISGDWAKGIDPRKAELKVGMMLEQSTPAPSTPWNKRYQADVLLRLDSQPMVTELTGRGLGDGRILVVSNASFLTNYGLVNRENQKLAQALVDSKRFDRSTLFLETGADGARVSDSEAGHETWAWITKPPLRYIIPHFLMLGVIFCFVLFPIFGRARRADPAEDSSTFRDHIRAMGKLLSVSGNIQFARDKIEKYTNRHWHEHKK